MDCCGPDSKNPNEDSDENTSRDVPSNSNVRKNVLIWGSVIVLIGGILIVWLW